MSRWTFTAPAKAPQDEVARAALDTDDRLAVDLGAALYAWWCELASVRGDRAALRRCDDLGEVLGVDAFHSLWFCLRQELERHGRTLSDNERDRLRAVAALLAQVRELGSENPPAQMARPRREGKGREAAVSRARFRRLLDAAGQDDMYLQLRRALALLDHKADIYRLAEAVMLWGEPVRKQWAYAYFGALQESGA